MSATITTTHPNGTEETAEPRVRVRIERGQRGSYGWEITVRGDDTDAVLHELQRADQQLRATYLSGNGLDFTS